MDSAIMSGLESSSWYKPTAAGAKYTISVEAVVEGHYISTNRKLSVERPVAKSVGPTSVCAS